MLQKPLVKPLEFRQWVCRKPSAGLIWAAPTGVQLQCAAAAAASTVKKTQAAAAARWRNTTPLPAPLLCMSERAIFPCFCLASHLHTPNYPREHYVNAAVCIVLVADARQRALWKFWITQQPAAVLWQLYSWCVQTIIVTVESTVSYVITLILWWHASAPAVLL